MPLTLNTAQLNHAITAAFQATVEVYADNCRNEIEGEYWQWDGYTLRRNGSIVGSPRNIVDTGELRDSQTEPYYETRDRALIEWDCDHALAVHNGTEKMAARPWTQTAKEKTDFEGTMSAELRKRLR